MKKVSAVILDLGGVVFDLDWAKMIQSFEIKDPALTSVADFSEWLLNWKTYDHFERGQMSPEEFFSAYKKELKLTQSYPELCKAWNQLIASPVSGVEEVIKNIKNVSVFALSNTNLTHYEYLMTFPVMSHFKKVFTSNEMGCRKPEKIIFDQIIQAIEIPHGEVLFVDDVVKNVDGARRAGLCGEQCVSSSVQLKEILTNYYC